MGDHLAAAKLYERSGAYLEAAESWYANGAKERAKALAGNGPLMVAGDHPLVAMLPEALDHTTNAPDSTIMLTDLQILLGAGMLYDSAVAGAGAFGKRASASRFRESISGISPTAVGPERGRYVLVGEGGHGRRVHAEVHLHRLIVGDRHLE